MLVLKTLFLYLKGMLFTNKDTLDVARYPLKDIFRTITKVFLVRNNVLEIALVIPKTQEHFKTSMLNARYKRLTFFVLLCKLCLNN